MVRVALLSLVERAGDSAGAARGDLRIGGRALVSHQLAQALALGCRRIVVLADHAGIALDDVRQAAERAGAQVHLIVAGSELPQLVTPADELIVLADGLFADPQALVDLLGHEPGVLCFPIEDGLVAGFERIDINRSDAGAMHLPGRVAQRLAEVPGDWSVPAALMRLAVQSGVPLRPAPVALIAAGSWRLIASEGDAHHAEQDWVRSHTPEGGSLVPGAWLANLSVRTLGPTVLHAGTRPALIGTGAALLGLLGLGAGWFGATSIGFVLLGLSWLVGRATDLLAEIERAALIRPAARVRTDIMLDWALDALFALLAGWRIAAERFEVGLARGLLPALFAPLVLLGLLRLLPRIARPRWRLDWLGDRFILGLVLAVVGLVLPFGASVGLAALALLVLALVVTRGDSPNPPLTSGG